MRDGIYIGIDGGGTHSSAAAVRPDGRFAAFVSGGGCNFHHAGVETVRRRIEEMVLALSEKARAPVARVCVGMSALDGPASPALLELFSSGPLLRGRLDLQSDAYAALMGFTRGGPGMIVLCGTGSMLLLMDEKGRQHVSGGWGYLLNDAGSAYSLARDALLAVAAEADGTGPATALTPIALRHFGVSAPRELIDKVYAPDCTPDRLADFAREVLTPTALLDGTARRILNENMAALALLAARLFQKAPGVNSLGMYGGIFAHSPQAREAFSASLRSRIPAVNIRRMEFSPEIGCVLHLFRQEGLLTEAVLETLRSTCKEVQP